MPGDLIQSVPPMIESISPITFYSYMIGTAIPTAYGIAVAVLKITGLFSKNNSSNGKPKFCSDHSKLSSDMNRIETIQSNIFEKYDYLIRKHEETKTKLKSINEDLKGVQNNQVILNGTMKEGFKEVQNSFEKLSPMRDAVRDLVREHNKKNKDDEIDF